MRLFFFNESDAKGAPARGVRQKVGFQLLSFHTQVLAMGWDSGPIRRLAGMGRRYMGAEGVRTNLLSKTLAALAPRMWTALPMVRSALFISLLMLSVPLQVAAVDFTVVGTSTYDGVPLSANITAVVTNDPTTFDGGLTDIDAILVIQVTNTSLLSTDPLAVAKGWADPIITEFEFNVPEGSDLDPTKVGLSEVRRDVGVDADGNVDAVPETDVETANLGETVVPSDYTLDLRPNFPMNINVTLSLEGERGMDRGIVNKDAEEEVASDWILSPVAPSFSSSMVLCLVLTSTSSTLPVWM